MLTKWSRNELADLGLPKGCLYGYLKGSFHVITNVSEPFLAI